MSKLLSEEFKMFMNGLNCNPIPLEFSQALTTSEFLHTLYSFVLKVSEESETLNDELKAEFTDKFNKLSGDLLIHVDDVIKSSEYMNSIYEVCKIYLANALGSVIEYVTFGLDDEGYFFAAVPDSLEKITFTTDLSEENYGKLVVEY